MILGKILAPINNMEAIDRKKEFNIFKDLKISDSGEKIGINRDE